MTYMTSFLGVLLLSMSLCSMSTMGENNDTSEKFNEVITEKPDVGLSEENKMILKKWSEMESEVANLASEGVRRILPTILSSTKEITISSRCSSSIMKMIYGIKKIKTWAIQMLDASGKIPNGIINGSFASLGDFDGCLSVDVPGSVPFRGQYCTVFINPPVPKRKLFQNMEESLPLFVNFTKKGTVMEAFSSSAQFFDTHVRPRTSVCVPSTCSREDVQEVIDSMVSTTGFPWNITVPTCDVIEPVVFSNSDVVIICVLGMIGLLAFVATTTDIILNIMSKEKRLKTEQSSTAFKCLMCFSAYTNTLRLLKKDTSPDSIKIFHGMKVITMQWVMLNHAYYYTNFNLTGAVSNARRFGTEIAFQLVANGFLNVETFFFISAALLAYGRMKFMGKNINIFLYIFRRVWRLTPPLMLVIATSMLIPHMGSGPGWKETMANVIDKCKSNWWTNLIYINNFIPSENMCFDWLWYIPVDTHLYILALLVIVPLKSRPRFALGINGMLFVAGTIMSALSHIYYNQQPTAIYVYSDKGDIRYYTDNSYFRSYTHITTCCIGLYAGYIMATRPNMKIPTALNILGWLCSIIFGLLVLYGVYDWNQGNVPGLAVSTLYMCTNKVVWALALSYVTIACFTGNGGIITSILSWSAFVPISRLTYATYLVHPIFLHMFVGSTRITLHTGHKTIVYRFLANTFVSYIFAYIVSLLFESPFMCLEKVMLSRKGTSSRKDPPESKSEENGKLEKEVNSANSVISTINLKEIETQLP